MKESADESDQISTIQMTYSIGQNILDSFFLFFTLQKRKPVEVFIYLRDFWEKILFVFCTLFLQYVQ